jgi:ribosomal protein S18 acetylase RimI-like enzyme
MENSLKYKKCDVHDLEILTDFSMKTFIDAFEKDNHADDFKSYVTSAFNEKQIECELLNADSEFYFVYSDNVIVAYFKINQNTAQAEPFGKGALELSRIYVLKDFQGNNYGANILQEIIKMAKEKHKIWLWLGVWQLNLNAVRFYERHGFSKFDMHSFYIGNDRQTDWLMRLDLV